MNNSQMENHITSTNWSYVNTKRIGSQDYDSHIGVLRVMFKLEQDPEEITTLLNNEKTEVWGRFEENWEKIF